MFPFTTLRRHPAMRKLGRRLERGAKAFLYRILSRRAGPLRPANPSTLEGVRRVLLVRPNFRLGNAVIGARLIEAIAEQHPHIEVDYLGTDTTRALFLNMPLAHYHALSRDMPLRPWRLFGLLAALRWRQYDLAIQVGEGSLTSWLFTQLCGARRTLGQHGRLEGTYDWVDDPSPEHAHELASSLAASLGLACRPRPWLTLSTQERNAAAATLVGLSVPGTAVGIFIGGHLDKRLPLPFWQTLLQELNARGQPYLVLLGPEEAQYLTALTSSSGVHGRILPPLPLREFAAVLAQLPRLITPDTGPMHMAAALEVPVVALLNVPGSRRFAPRGPADLVLFQPEPTAVADLVSSCPVPAAQPALERVHVPVKPETGATRHRYHDDRGRDNLHAHPAGGG
ncbi:glycosyltransferase family 9 protein [Billgrantia diversa]|uniref:glycosyltransferase family 9 protein n=1 Tax=Halomonas sp. MCCC 1A13316 TaxID=2733487 RepID=UPI0018A6670C|nr:glycosyltransferase family 9 protein [Halomonas sp. MCCC 1A13316]QOR38056.1 glycosyltransferase family 9 protein [Halomonas sp. MCCC 1A13316]